MKLDIQSTRNRTILDFRSKDFGNLCVLGRYHYNKAEKDLEAHRHKGMVEICYYDKGSQIFAVDHEKFLVKGGDLFIHFPDEVHGSGGYPEEKGSMYWFIIKHTGGAGNRADKEIDYLLQQLILARKRHFKGGAEVKKLLEEIFSTMQLKKIPKEILTIKVRLLTQLFLLKIIEKSKSDERETDNNRLNKVYRLIDTKLTEAITIAMLAKEANFSESRFKSWFKELSGFTPLDYVQRCRVQYAVKKLREDPLLSFKDLAYELNFSSQQYFSTVVKKFTGKSPGQLKHQHKIFL